MITDSIFWVSFEFSNARIVFSLAKILIDLMSLSFNESKFSAPFQLPELFWKFNSSKQMNLIGGYNLLYLEYVWPMLSFVTALKE